MKKNITKLHVYFPPPNCRHQPYPALPPRHNRGPNWCPFRNTHTHQQGAPLAHPQHSSICCHHWWHQRHRESNGTWIPPSRRSRANHLPQPGRFGRRYPKPTPPRARRARARQSVRHLPARVSRCTGLSSFHVASTSRRVDQQCGLLRELQAVCGAHARVDIHGGAHQLARHVAVLPGCDEADLVAREARALVQHGWGGSGWVRHPSVRSVWCDKSWCCAPHKEHACRAKQGS